MPQTSNLQLAWCSKQPCKKDRLPFQFEEAETSFGGLGPPSPSLVTSLFLRLISLPRLRMKCLVELKHCSPNEIIKRSTFGEFGGHSSLPKNSPVLVAIVFSQLAIPCEQVHLPAGKYNHRLNTEYFAVTAPCIHSRNVRIVIERLYSTIYVA